MMLGRQSVSALVMVAAVGWWGTTDGFLKPLREARGMSTIAVSVSVVVHGSTAGDKVEILRRNAKGTQVLAEGIVDERGQHTFQVVVPQQVLRASGGSLSSLHLGGFLVRAHDKAGTATVVPLGRPPAFIQRSPANGKPLLVHVNPPQTSR